MSAGPTSLERNPKDQRQALLAMLLKKEGLSLPKESGLVRHPANEPSPLTEAQQWYWFLDQLQPGNGFYNTPMSVLLTGKLDVEALQSSLTEIARRHEILRSFYTGVNGETVCEIDPSQHLDFRFEDISDSPQASDAEHLRARATALLMRPFDLSRGPAWRAELLRMSASEYFLSLSFHHIVFDGWSRGIFLRELSELYGAFSKGAPTPLEDLEFQYGDYAFWQREWLVSDAARKQIAFWKEYLSDLPQQRDLPLSGPRPAVQTHRAGGASSQLSSEILGRVRTLSSQEGATVFMTLLGAFFALLHRMTGQEDILVGTPTAGRGRPEIEGVIGCFSNTLVLRSKLSLEMSFGELLKNIRTKTVTAFENSDVPFKKLVEVAHRSSHAANTSLYQAMFALYNVPRTRLEMEGLEISALPVTKEAAKLDLMFSVTEQADGLLIAVQYNTDIYSTSAIDRLIDGYRTILAFALDHPDRPLNSLDLIVGENSAATLSTGEYCGPSFDDMEEQCLRTEHLQTIEPNALSQNSHGLPQSYTQAQVSQLFGELTGTDSVGPDDNFFDVGGHSMLAVRLIYRIGQIYGVNLPLASLFTNATPRKLAELIERNPPPESWTTLVPIQPLGSQLPIYCASKPNRNALGYVFLSKELGMDQPVYGLQSQWRSEINGPYTQTEYEAVAAEYIQQVRSVQPSGPYFLAGMCEGAHIAFEMARQLEADGDEVGAIFMLDAWTAENSRIYWLWRCEIMRITMIGRSNTLMKLIRGKIKRSESLPKRIDAAVEAKTADIDADSASNASSGKAPMSVWLERYWPGPDWRPNVIKAPLVILRMKQQRFYRPRDPNLGWTNRTTGVVKSYVLNGSHSTLLREPHVRMLAGMIRRSKNEILAGAGVSEPVAALPNKSGEARQSPESASKDLPLSV